MVPGCPEPTANQALIDAAIVFCEDSLAIRSQLDRFNTVVGQSQYLLEAVESGEQVSRVMHVTFDGAPIEVIPYERVGVPPAVSGRPLAAYAVRDGADFYLTLWPTPDTVAPVDVVAAVRPNRNATQLSDDLLNRWSDAVIHGALSRIMSIPNQPFSDPAGAQTAMLMATRASSRARVEGSYGRVRGQIAVTSRPFA